MSVAGDLGRRLLHFVFKIGDRTNSMKFFQQILQLKVLRHEEFEEGCKATCNGPYDGKWSKTMIGYGPEDTNFVFEITYNYGVSAYKKGNDFQGITIASSDIIARIKEFEQEHNIDQENGEVTITSPCNYSFRIVKNDNGTKMERVTLSCSNLKKSLEYWGGLLKMDQIKISDQNVYLTYGENQTTLELVQITGPIERGSAFGRVAFSCPSSQLSDIEQTMKDANQTILTPLVSLDTPGKATVQVVILADPDGHEICFVGDEAFRELSQVDPKGQSLLDAAITADKSNEWYEKHGKNKEVI